MSTGVLVPTHGAAAAELLVALGVTPTATSLDIVNDDMSFEDFENIGRAIGFFGNAWQWWVGDWLNFGEMVFGEEAAQAVDDKPTRYDIARRVTGKDQGTLMNIRSTCGKVAKSRRRAELDFSHHVVVSALEPDDQSEWLQRAIDCTWSRTDLRDAIREAKNPTATPVDTDPPVPDESVLDRCRKVLALVEEQAQTMTNGGWFIPDEVMAQVRAINGGTE